MYRTGYTLIMAGLIAATNNLPSPAFAQEAAKVAEIVIEESEEIKAIKERKESAVSKTVITRKEMEELGGQTAADVLRRLPRTFFSGPPATNKDIRQGGLDKEFQNILINGNRPPGGGEKREFALDRIPVEQIERIELLKNPTAAYDADAIAGLVDIILKNPPKQRELTVFAGTSQNDRANELGNKFSVVYGDKLGIMQYGIGATRNDEYRQKLKTAKNTAKNEQTAESELNRTITTAFNPTFTFQMGKNDKINFKPFFTDSSELKQKDTLVTTLSNGANKNRTVERELKGQFLQSYLLDWQHRFSGGGDMKLTASYSRNDEDRGKNGMIYSGGSLTYNKSTYDSENKKDEEFVGSMDYKRPLADLLWSDHIVKAGLKLRHKNRDVEKLVSETGTNGIAKITSTPDDTYRVRETIGAVYLMDEASITEKLTITPGLRMELTDGGYKTSGGRSADGSYTDWNPSLHARYALTGNLILRASMARTIGRPEFKAMVPTVSVKKDKVEVGNPDLKAATSYNYEAGVEYYLPGGAVAALGGFYKDINNVIEKKTIGTDPGTNLPLVKPVNAGKASVYGGEIEIKSDLSVIGLKEFSMAANYSLLGSNVADATTGVNRRLIDQPHYLSSLIARYDNREFGFGASIGFIQIGRKENAGSIPTKYEKAYNQLDLSITQKLGKGVSLHASMLNLTDSYRSAVFSDGKTEKEEVGRTWYLGMRFEL